MQTPNFYCNDSFEAMNKKHLRARCFLFVHIVFLLNKGLRNITRLYVVNRAAILYYVW